MCRTKGMLTVCLTVGPGQGPSAPSCREQVSFPIKDVDKLFTGLSLLFLTIYILAFPDPSMNSKNSLLIHFLTLNYQN
jgi:hypothetical protein